MNFRNIKKHDQDSIDLTPLIDVVFILLIFFMVTTTFQRESRLAVNLPQASEKADPETQEMLLEVVIDSSGRYYVNGQELLNHHPDTLKQALKEISRGKKDKPLVIRADAKTPHQSVVIALDTAAQLGLVRVSIATTQPE